MSAPQVNTAPRGRKTVGKQPKAPQVIVLILGWKIAGTSAGSTGGILKCTPAVEAIAPQVNVYVAPQVDVQILERNNAGTSAGATGGILKPTPAVEAIAPQVYTQAPQVNTYMNTSKPFMRMIQQSRIVRI